MNSWTRITMCFLLLASFCLLLISLSSCGRRGDPVAIMPQEEDIVTDAGKEADKVEEEAQKEQVSEDAERDIIQPDRPKKLTALFTGVSVVLTWNEIIGQGVISYKVYRAEGNNYVLIGETATPAFTDRNIKLNTKYYYRVTATGKSESPPSEKIEVLTEDKE